uniref:(northern house mosquito) hypothetical protein n=1 Tax=Culex pipiens TaxID=7175 RepID=A0A8D8A3Z9_CULPI
MGMAFGTDSVTAGSNWFSSGVMSVVVVVVVVVRLTVVASSGSSVLLTIGADGWYCWSSSSISSVSGSFSAIAKRSEIWRLTSAKMPWLGSVCSGVGSSS